MNNFMGAKNNCEKNYVKCENCAMEPVCVPIATNNGSINLADTYLTKRSPVDNGNSAFDKDDSLSDIYAVCSGVFKLCDTTEKGDEKIVGFRFPGELLGDDALYPEKYGYSAVAIGESSICEVTVSDLVGCSKAVPDLQLKFVNLLTRQSYVNHQELDAVVAKKTAESLLTAFLLNVAARTAAHNGSSTSFTLPMSRDDIANFLGVRRETLSRIFSKLQKDELIEMRGKHIQLLSPEKLQELANL